MSKVKWREEYLGGSQQAEQVIFEGLARDIVAIQMKNRATSGSPHGNRTLHAKSVVAVDNATLKVRSDLPEDLCAGHFQPGAEFPATLRLSNANGLHRPDGEADMRGAAVRVHFDTDKSHDLLMTSYATSHARDAIQFVQFAQMVAAGKATLLPKMLFKFGPAETLRIVKNLKQAVRACDSLARESFWSRGAVLWGDTPVQLRLSPGHATEPAAALGQGDADSLRREFATRLAKGDVDYVLSVQRYVDEERTPIETGSVEWKESDSPWILVATLTVPKQDILGKQGIDAQQRVDAQSFSPWNAPEAFRPLGNLNRARGPVYAASAAKWMKP